MLAKRWLLDNVDEVEFTKLLVCKRDHCELLCYVDPLYVVEDGSNRPKHWLSCFQKRLSVDLPNALDPRGRVVEGSSWNSATTSSSRVTHQSCVSEANKQLI